MTLHGLLLALFIIPVAGLAGAQQSSPDAPSYVGSEQCSDCHRDQSDAWSGSYHQLAWTLPTPDTVKADFDGTEFSHDGMHTRFRIEGGGYFATVTEKDGTTRDYKVHSVAGIAPLQQYLLETEEGRLQSFDVVWDTENERWYHLYPDQDLPPSDAYHWTGPYKTWNARCAECHATGYEKNYSRETRSYASTQAEIGVGCEACHGPGSAHLAWARNGALPAGSDAMDAYGFSMTFDSAEATIQQCAGCHSRREAFGNGNPLPGTLYHDAYGLALLRPGLYHPDGQISDEVYVYGSFLQSKMYARGVGCTNCHDAHSTELKAEGNGVCAQCHSPAGNPAFPTLRPKVYDGPEHTFHAAGSPGAQCKSCHMIERVYMGIDGRRDHSFRIPRPDLAAQTGGPDACTDCHSDKRADWAAARIAEWYPDSMHRGPHYGQTLAQGMHDPSAVLGPLGDLAADTEQAGIVRATALWLLEQSGDAASADRAEPLLQDPDPLVRNAAADLQRAASPQNRVSRLVALLHDPVRAVRMTAARQFLDAPIAHMPPTMSEDLQAAMTEWRASLNNQLDFPEIQMRLGGMGLTLRNIRLATAGFREAVVLDAQLTAAWMMLARIAAATEGPQAAQSVLEEALTRNPDDLGLIQSLSELGAPAGKLTP